MSSADDELLCTVGGASMYVRRDAPTLEDGGWLGTEAVTFWLEILERGELAGAAASSCALVHPSAVALHELLDSEGLCDALSGLRLHERGSAVFAICNAGPEGARMPNAGTHWSLLAWSRAPAAAAGGTAGGTAGAGGAHALVHFDSVPRSGNAAHARRFAAAAWPLLAGAGAGAGAGGAPPALREGLCGAQANDSDCGVHALLAAELVARAAAAAAAATGAGAAGGLDLAALDLRAYTTPAHAAALRARMRGELAARAAAARAGK